MLDLSYAFVIFFLTLGPLKTVPAFLSMARDLPGDRKRRLALLGTLYATVIVFLIVLVVGGILDKWRVSLQALQIAGGILLFLSAQGVLSHFSSTAPPQEHAGEPRPPLPHGAAKTLALSPLAVPTIITPIGVVAILLFSSVPQSDLQFRLGIYGLLVAIMLLNLIGMWFADQIIKFVGIANLRVTGWIFAVLQAGLGVQAVVGALRQLNVIPS